MLKEPPREWRKIAEDALKDSNLQSITVLYAESFRFDRDDEGGVRVGDRSEYYHVTAKRTDGHAVTGSNPDLSAAVEETRVKLKAGLEEGDDA
jgi:hypothetical protein